MAPPKTWLKVILSLSVVAALLGVILACCSGFIENLILQSQMVLSPHSVLFPFWKDLPVPLFVSMYIFNLTNAKDVQLNGAKPELVQLGPFVYREMHHKTKLVWNANNYTVTYRQVKTWHYQPHMSNGSLDDMATIVNMPMATIGAMSLQDSSFTRGLINAGLTIIREKLFVTKKIRQILFDGYKDPILDAAKDGSSIGIPMPPGLMDKFGFYYGKNGTDWADGIWNIHTGYGNINKLGRVAAWNYSSHSKFFKDQCGVVSGGADLLPPLQRGNSIQIYNNDLCRPINLNYTGVEKQVYGGVSGRQFVMEESFFANSTENKDNWCFETGKHPLPSGVFNASACRFGAPVYLSQPHFYQADSFYANKLAAGSMNPDKKKHETEFIVEQTSGVPLSVKARFQVNAMIQNIPELNEFKHLNQDDGPLFLPTIWFENTLLLEDKKMTVQLWWLSKLYMIIVIVGCVMAGSAVAILVASGIIYGAQSKAEECNLNDGGQQSPILEESSSTDISVPDDDH